MIDEKQKKGLLAVGIAICLLLAGSKIYKVYRSFQPPYQVGECFEITAPQVGRIVFKVVENDRSKQTTDAVGSVDFGFAKIQIPARASFEELRDPEIKGAKCED